MVTLQKDVGMESGLLQKKSQERSKKESTSTTSLVSQDSSSDASKQLGSPSATDSQESLDAAMEKLHLTYLMWDCGYEEGCPWVSKLNDSRPEVLDDKPQVNLKCGRCLQVKHCSKECQKADWPEHKLGCKKSEMARSLWEQSRVEQVAYERGEAMLEEFERSRQQQLARLREVDRRWAAGSIDEETNAELLNTKEDARMILDQLAQEVSLKKEEMMWTHRNKVQLEEANEKLKLTKTIMRTAARFMTRLVDMNKERLVLIGLWLYVLHKKKGAITIEVESTAALENIIKWLGQRRGAFKERGENGGTKMVPSQAASEVLQLLFLGEKVKGVKKLAYLTLPETKSKIKAMERAFSAVSPTVVAMQELQSWKDLADDMQAYDERCSVIIHISLLVEEVKDYDNQPLLLLKWLEYCPSG